MRPIVVAHGLEGSPDGTKVRAFRDAGLDVVAPDGRGQPLAVRVERLREAVLRHPGAVLVGSSYGGLAATALVHALGAAHGLCALCLLAPALHWSEPPVADPSALLVPADLPCTVFHGTGDDVVPIDVSWALAARCPHVRVVATDDDHRLTATLPDIVRHVVQIAR